jgi:NAD(P)-dependent dehydrogenase (short-subunit alcohol dehydrogenase family)
MDKNANNPVVLVTGAAKGIGKCIAETYAFAGYRVALADMDWECGNETCALLQKKGFDSIFIQSDISDVQQVVALVAQVTGHFRRLDVVINNAGISLKHNPLKISESEWDLVLDTNLKGAFFVAREAAKWMKCNKSNGSIVNVASTRALMSERNSEAYAASKGGLLALSHALAASLAKHHITVNAVLPGWIETGDYSKIRKVDHEQHFSKRVGKPEDIARACLFLTKPENNFITGTQLIVDGGMTHKMIYVD